MQGPQPRDHCSNASEQWCEPGLRLYLHSEPLSWILAFYPTAYLMSLLKYLINISNSACPRQNYWSSLLQACSVSSLPHLHRWALHPSIRSRKNLGVAVDFSVSYSHLTNHKIPSPLPSLPSLLLPSWSKPPSYFACIIAIMSPSLSLCSFKSLLRLHLLREVYPAPHI